MVFIILSVFTLLFLPASLKRNNEGWTTFIIVAAYIIVFAMRSMMVADTDAYYDIYNNNLGESTIEKGYLFLNQIIRGLGCSYHVFLFFIALFNLAIWSLFTKKCLSQKNLIIPLLFFMSFAGVYNYGIILRAAISESIMLIAVSTMLGCCEKGVMKNSSSIIKDRKKSDVLNVLILFFALLFICFNIHQTSLIFIFILMVYFIPLNPKMCSIITALSLLFFLFPSSQLLISQRIGALIEYNELRLGYRLEEDGDFRLGVTNIFLALSAFYYTYCIRFIDGENNRRKYLFILNVFVVGVLITALFSYIRAGARLGLMLTFFEYLLPSMLVLYSSVKHRKIVLSVMMVMVIVNLYKLLTNVPSLWNYID